MSDEEPENNNLISYIPTERALRARLDQIETEMSRMRSVLYLLVKDRPDMLRLLGQPPPESAL